MSTDPPIPVRAWLHALGALVATTMPFADARERLAVFTPLLEREFSPTLFTEEALSFVARQAKHFPNYHELCEFLAAWRREQNPYRETERVYPLLDAPIEAAKEAEPYVVTSTPGWVGKHGPHFNPRPEAGEIDAKPPIRDPVEQARSIGVSDSEVLAKIRAQAEAAANQDREAPKPSQRNAHHHTLGSALGAALATKRPS